MRIVAVVGIIVLSAIAAWWVWPRPNVEIRIARGGTATVVDHMGRRSPLGDTIFVRGGGGKRTVRVINEDTMPHQLAMFNAVAGGTRDYTVPLGVYGGFCSAHATSKRLTVVVR